MPESSIATAKEDMQDMKAREARILQVVEDLLKEAKKLGADAAEAGASQDSGLGLSVRMGELETIEFSRDSSLGISLYFGQRKGSASTSDFSAQAIRDTVRAAADIARFTSADPYAGLAEAALMAKDLPDLELYHPWDIEVEAATELCIRCEEAGRSLDPRICNSEGASLSSGTSLHIYGNSQGFLAGYPQSRHSISCSLLAGDDRGMQRDYWYSTDRDPTRLKDAAEVGRIAAERTLARLGARGLGTLQAPVIFRAEVATSLLRNFTAAIRGGALYRKASFLLDSLGKPVFPDFVRIHEDPRRPRALSSAPFDNEGVATCAKDLVRDGRVQSYILDSYSARKLGMATTANAGGVRNLSIESGDLDLDGLMRQMGSGLLVTELMGQGVNTVTGDFSRGAAGFWVENGQIAWPVEEITIAGNLKDMFQNLVAVANDQDLPGATKTGSWLLERMTIAGN